MNEGSDSSTGLIPEEDFARGVHSPWDHFLRLTRCSQTVCWHVFQIKEKNTDKEAAENSTSGTKEDPQLWAGASKGVGFFPGDALLG